MKKIKKLGALIMAFAMVLSLSVTALAVDEADSKDVTVKFTSLNAGETVTAYKMVQYDANYNKLSFTQGDAEKGFYQYLIQTVEDMKGEEQDEVIEHLAGMSGKISINMISDYVTDAAVNHTKWEFPGADYQVSATASGENTNASATLKLTPGWYLVVVEPGGNDQRNYMPTMIFVKATTGESEVYANGDPEAVAKPEDGTYTFAIKHTDAIDVTKQVWDADQNKWNDTASESVGGTLNFRVRVSLPGNLDDLDQYTITLSDMMTNLSLVAGSVKVYGEPSINTWGSGSEEVPTGLTELTAATDYTVDGLNITMNVDSLKTKGYTGIYVTYSATLDASAAAYGDYTKHTAQATNTVTLTYGTPSNTNDKTASTSIYTYSFDLKKIGEKVSDNLDGMGAKFAIYNVDPSAEENANAEPLKFVKVDDTYYRLALEGDENAVTEIEANFKVQGLDNGTYYLKETATPSGYYAPEEPFVLTLVRDYQSNELSEKSSLTGQAGLVAQTAVNDATPYLYDITIMNSTHPQLPTTGGMGTVIFTVGGVALMGAAAVLFFATRKKKAEQ